MAEIKIGKSELFIQPILTYDFAGEEKSERVPALCFELWSKNTLVITIQLRDGLILFKSGMDQILLRIPLPIRFATLLIGKNRIGWMNRSLIKINHKSKTRFVPNIEISTYLDEEI